MLTYVRYKYKKYRKFDQEKLELKKKVKILEEIQ